MRLRLDQLGKNVLRDFLILLGLAETEAEVPPGDAQRIDLWFVPDPARLRAFAGPLPDLLAQMVAEPAMVELFAGTIDEPDFNACLRKRYQWHHVLELRDERPWVPPWLCAVSAYRPAGILDDFGFVAAEGALTGNYQTAARGWRVRIVVVSELPRTRDTVLVRLLGSRRQRLEAIRDLLALPPDAWERRVALPWLVRLKFEVPADLSELPADERDLIMETREWFEQYQRQIEDRGRVQGRLQTIARLIEKRIGRPLVEPERATLAERLDHLGEDRIDEVVRSFDTVAGKGDSGAETRERFEQYQRQIEDRGRVQGRLQTIARLIEKRIGRPLVEPERATLAERLDHLGEDRVDDAVLSLSPAELAAWLADPAAT